METKIILIVGPPFSGKGTQAQLLSSKIGYKHISVGEFCRAQKNAHTPLGIELLKFKENGGLIPAETIKQIVSDIFKKNFQEKGIILEGYPILVQQVYDFLEIVGEGNLTITNIFYLKSCERNLFNRVRLRSITSRRPDDLDPTVNKERMEFFNLNTLPAITLLDQIFKTIFITIDGDATIERISSNIFNYFIN
jgi:adenylate kinase